MASRSPFYLDHPIPAPPLSVRLVISWLTNALVLGVAAALLSGVDVLPPGCPVVVLADYRIDTVGQWPVEGVIHGALVRIFSVLQAAVAHRRALLAGMIHSQIVA